MKKSGKLLSIIMALFLTLGILLPAQITVHAEKAVPNGYYYIRNKATGTYLDVPNSQIAWFTQVIAYPFNGDDNQYWEVQDGIDGYCRIRSNLHTNYFLDVENGSFIPGTPVQMFGDYGPDLASSNFSITSNDDGSYAIRLYNAINYCIAVGDDGNMIVQRYIGRDNQKWYFDNNSYGDKPYNPNYPYLIPPFGGIIESATEYYDLLSTFDYSIRNEVTYTMTSEQIGNFQAHLVFIKNEDGSLADQKGMLEALVSLAEGLISYIPYLGDVLGVYDIVSTINILEDYKTDLSGLYESIYEVTHYVEQDETGKKHTEAKPDSVTYKISFLRNAPTSGYQIKITSSDGGKLVYSVDEDVFSVAEYVAVNYASHTCVYKVAPGYSYFLEG